LGTAAVISAPGQGARDIVAPMRSSLISAGALALFLISASARAGDGDLARAAYESGEAAYKKGDYAAAATALALADAIAPNPVALEAALKAVVRTGDAALGMDLVERADQRPAGPSVAELALRARTQFAALAGRIIARCPPEPACVATVAGQPMTLGKPRWIAAGDRVVTFTIDGKNSLEALHVDPGATVEIAPRAALPQPLAAPIAPPSAPPPVVPPSPPAPVAAPPAMEPLPPPRGISPAWFVLGGVVTVGLGAGAIACGVDTLNKHSAFTAEPTTAAATAGQAAQARTNGFLIGTGVAAAATAAIGLFAVRWSNPSRDADSRPLSLTVAATLGGLSASGQY
jgi:hypothetical protein